MNHEPPFEITEPGVVVDKHGLIALKFDNDYRGVVEGLVSTANGLEVNKTFERSAAKLKTHRQTIDVVEVSRVIEQNYGCDLVLKDKTVLRSTNEYEPTRNVFFGEIQ